MGRFAEWFRKWRTVGRGKKNTEVTQLALERLEARQMLANGACLVVDFATPPETAAAGAWLVLESVEHASETNGCGTADSSRFVYLDDLAEELGNVFDLEDDDLWWMGSDHPWGSQST